MYSQAKQGEIDHRTIRLIVGFIPIFLAILTDLFSQNPLQAISAAYHEGGWSRDIFVGFLFTISAFLLAYNGKSIPEMVLGKIAALAAVGVAMFPCKCVSYPEIIPYVHGISALVMFVILSIFCYIFFQRAYTKGYAQARTRAYIYALCGITIITSIAIIAMDHLPDGIISLKINRLTFYCEAAALFAFGFAWLIASHILPYINREDERFRPLPFKKCEAKPNIDAK